MLEALNDPNYEFFLPLRTGWLAKIEAAHRARKKWNEVSAECQMFYSKSAAAMWDQDYSRKFWSNVKAPKFRMTINKAFELVAVFGPNLLWDTPYRAAKPIKRLEIPEELFATDPQGQQIYETLQKTEQQDRAKNTMVAHLMQSWLNYTPGEMPGGGLMGQSELAVIDALVKGRGCLWLKPFTYPGSGRQLTGAFRHPPEDLFIDPDFKSLNDAKWIALRHVEAHWEVERRFNLPAGSLKNKTSLESSTHWGEMRGTFDGGVTDRISGKTNDLVLWYEIFSKTGVGSRMTDMPAALRDELESTVGDYAYLAICPECPYPLNAPTDVIRSESTDAESVKQMFSWPVPLWMDDRWPVQVLDFYPDPESAWPIPPIAPGLGELKFLNFLVPWLANRVWSSSRDFWAVAGPHFEKYKKYLQEGDDQVVMDVPPDVDDVRKAITVLQQPETRMDVWKIIELVSQMFDKRTGLTEFAYGKNEDGTQNRTAEETLAKKAAVGVRPEYMAKKVVGWQSDVAAVEAIMSQLFVTEKDVVPLLGQAGGYLWREYIEAADPETIMRQISFTVEASSIRRPNRDRDIANLQQVMQLFAPTYQAIGMEHGNWGPWNAMVKQWADFHDADMDAMAITAPEPDPSAQQQQQLQLADVQADVQLKQARAEQMQAKTQIDAAKLQIEQQPDPNELLKPQMEMQKHRLELLLDSQKGKQELQQSNEKHKLAMKQAEEKLALEKKRMAMKPKGSAA